MHIAEGYLAVATHDASASGGDGGGDHNSRGKGLAGGGGADADAAAADAAASQFSPSPLSTLSVYALSCDPAAGSVSLSFHSPVVGGEGRTNAVAICDGVLWALQEGGRGGERERESGRDRGTSAADLSGSSTSRVLKGWPLEALNRTHPCETMGAAAAALAGWGGGGGAGATGAAAALLLRGAAVPGSGAATAADVADGLAGELAARGITSQQVLASIP
jgi:nuclear pore complex protein Nup160